MNKIYSILCSISLALTAIPSIAQNEDFEVKGMHIDLRTQVMTIDALKQLATDASQNGINTIVMEWEATFPFEKHPTLCNKLAYTKKEVESFVSHCTGLGIDVIPLQNCFGHCDYILRHQRYAAIREDAKDPSQVCPTRIGRCKEVFTEIFSEVVAMHPSKYIHIGADETRLLGKCKNCAAKVSSQGTSRLFVDYVTAMCEIVRELGKTPIIWSDMILKHPEAVGQLPKDLIILDWNYGWDWDHFGPFSNIEGKDLSLWGATALRSGPDNINIVMWKKHFDNLATYIPEARRRGLKGMIETSWSTSGQYSFVYDEPGHINQMQPWREVYPLSGFRILQIAYCKAVNSMEPLDWRAFVKNYGEERFGIKDGETFLSYFDRVPLNVNRRTKVSDVEAELKSFKELKESFGKLKPSANKNEFEHFRLMLDIRINYLEYKIIDLKRESPDYTAPKAAELKSAIEPVYKESLKLRKRFINLNKSYLKDPSISCSNWLYFGSIEDLYQTLK